MRIICQFSEGRDWMSSYTLYIQRRFHTSTTLVIIPYSRFASVKYPISPTLSTLLPYSFCRLLHPTKSSLRCVGGIFLLRSLVGAKPLHLACARPFGRLKAPLGLSLLRFANAVPPQTLLRIQKIRTLLLSEKSSDFVVVVHLQGLDPWAH